MRAAVRVGAVTGASAVLAGWIWAAGSTRAPLWTVTLPAVGAVWTLTLLHHGYLAGREWAHRRRRRTSRDRRAAWAPAAGTRPGPGSSTASAPSSSAGRCSSSSRASAPTWA